MPGQTTRWLRLSASHSAAVMMEAAPLVDELTDSIDIAGVYVNEAGTSYRVVYTAIERRPNGRKLRRQRTRNFHRRATYDAIQLPAFGWIDEPNALQAAWAFKLKMDEAARVGRSLPSDEALTVEDVFLRFMASKPRAPKTEEGYRLGFAKHLRPTLGSWLIAELDVHAVERWHAELDAKPTAKRAATQLLKAVTNYAMRRGVIAQDPARVLTVPQSNVRALAPDEVPTDEQVDRLAVEIGDRYSVLVYLLAYGGLRIGEAVALRVDRIDFLRRRITIDASATEVNGRLVTGPTKTGASTRTFTAPTFLVDMLAQHIERWPTTTGLVFSAPDGGQLRPGNFRRRVFDKAAERAVLAGLHLHDLRHAAASHLAADGASAVEIAARLGHANPAITQRVYTHLLEARDQRLAAQQDEAFRQRRT
jgi:integrase